MRYLTPEINRLFSEERKMCFISGPRQVGKTTLAKHILTRTKRPSAYFSWDIDADRKAILKHPDDFWLQRELAMATKFRLVLDEIHKFPRWKRFLKGFFDANSGTLETLVTGSGRLDVYQRGGDSLFGRYHLYHLHPFTLGEYLSDGKLEIPSPGEFFHRMAEPYNAKALEDALRTVEKFTGFPEPLFSESETRLRRWSNSHEQLIVREDLRDLTRIRELGLIESLVTLLPEKIGSPLSVNSLREDIGVRFETVQNWLAALGRLFFLFAIRPYTGKLVRTLRREEKIYLYDFTPITDVGARFENLVALHLMKLCHFWTDYGYGRFDLHYVRDREKREVDFLIAERGKPFALIEAKLNASAIDPSLRYFTERFKPRHSIQIVRNPDRLKGGYLSEGILIVPASQALAAM